MMSLILMKLYNPQEILSNDWISKCQKNTFGIILPTGWLGRPFDNKHTLKNVEVNADMIKFIFDDIRSLTIYGPIECEMLNDTSYTSLKIIKFSKIELEWIPYDDEINVQTVVKSYIYTEGATMVLVGYFI